LFGSLAHVMKQCGRRPDLRAAILHDEPARRELQQDVGERGRAETGRIVAHFERVGDHRTEPALVTREDDPRRARGRLVPRADDDRAVESVGVVEGAAANTPPGSSSVRSAASTASCGAGASRAPTS